MLKVLFGDVTLVLPRVPLPVGDGPIHSQIRDRLIIHVRISHDVESV